MKEATDLTLAGHVTVSYSDKVSTIEFQHPSHNSLPSKLLSELANAIIKEGAKEEVVLILVKSGGDRTFCAGASFDELVAIEDKDVGKKFFMGFANVINAIRACGKIVIGRVQGKAVGGGVGLASAFDYCMASKYASIKLSELAVGIGPFVIGPAVERKMGLSAYSQMAINAKEWYTAEWGKARGLYHEVFESTEQLDAYTEHFINNLKEMNPEALVGLKKVFWEGTAHWNELLEERAAQSGKLVLSDFSKKTIRGFLKA